MSKQQDSASECFHSGSDSECPAGKARSALLPVERGEAQHGIVRGTDARARRRATGDGKVRDARALFSGMDAEPSWRRFGFTMGH